MKKLLVGLCTIFICTFALAHSIEWYVDGSLYQTTTCNSGDSVTPPTAPEKYGYHFVKWSTYYTQLEYIESTGTQYIVTGVSSSDGYDIIRINIDIQSVETGESSYYAFGRFANGANYVYDAGGVWGNGVANSITSSRKKTNIDAIFEYETLNLVFNGTDILNRSDGYESPGTKFILFGVGSRLGKFKIWDAKIWKNDELVRNLVPARRAYDNAVGMYDLVSGQFFTNAGTGEFIAGPDVGGF